MDHSHDHAAVDGPSAAGWAQAVLAGLVAVMLSSWLGDMTAFGLVVIGLVVFGVFAVLLGSGGVELTVTDDHGDSHDAHGHH